MLGGFHTAKCLQHSVGKYIRDFVLEESLHQTRIFGVKIVDSVLDGTHYVRSLKGLLILANAIKKLKCSAFTQTIQSDSITEFESNVRSSSSLSNQRCKTKYTCFKRNLQTRQLRHQRWYDTWKNY